MEENPYKSPEIPDGRQDSRHGDLAKRLSRWIHVALMAIGITAVILTTVSTLTHLLDQ